MNTFNNNLQNETIKSTGRAGAEIVATTLSLLVLGAKSTAAAWHSTEIGNAARSQAIMSTARMEGTTKDVMVDAATRMKNVFSGDDIIENDEQVTLNG